MWKRKWTSWVVTQFEILLYNLFFPADVFAGNAADFGVAWQKCINFPTAVVSLGDVVSVVKNGVYLFLGIGEF